MPLFHRRMQRLGPWPSGVGGEARRTGLPTLGTSRPMVLGALKRPQCSSKIPKNNDQSDKCKKKTNSLPYVGPGFSISLTHESFLDCISRLPISGYDTHRIMTDFRWNCQCKIPIENPEKNGKTRTFDICRHLYNICTVN